MRITVIEKSLNEQGQQETRKGTKGTQWAYKMAHPGGEEHKTWAYADSLEVGKSYEFNALNEWKPKSGKFTMYFLDGEPKEVAGASTAGPSAAPSTQVHSKELINAACAIAVDVATNLDGAVSVETANTVLIQVFRHGAIHARLAEIAADKEQDGPNF